METFSENIAHFTHGMVFMFFIFVAAHLYWQQNTSRLLWFLFYEAIFYAFIELKDIAYLIEGVWYTRYLTYIFLSIDMWIIPFTMLFLFELMSPGWVTVRRGTTLIIPSLILTVLLIFIHSDILFYGIVAYSLLLGAIALFVVFMVSAQYNNYVKKNFSYTEGLSISWVRTIIVILFVYLILWIFIQRQESWWGDAFYYLITISIWSFIYFYTLQHAVIEIPDILYRFRKKESESTAIEEDGCPYPFAESLKEVMERERLYLNPKLHITDVASAISTNRTYLSDYLNKHLDTTFYDYVNTFRVEMACKLLMIKKKQTLEQIAEECGFNSLSTFNRSFYKIKKCNPSDYRNSH